MVSGMNQEILDTALVPTVSCYPFKILNDLSNLMLTKSMQSEWCQTLDSNFGPTFPNGLPYYMAHIRLDMNFT